MRQGRTGAVIFPTFELILQPRRVASGGGVAGYAETPVLPIDEKHYRRRYGPVRRRDLMPARREFGTDAPADTFAYCK